MFHDAHRFAFTARLEEHWSGIYAEYLGVANRLVDWFERELYGEGWQVFGLFDFPHGRAIAENVARCPLTASLIERHVPRHGAAGFSVLRPGTRIRPHEGFPGPFLRCHVGLRVPPGDCGLRVADESRGWKEGEALVLDDRVRHEAWNLTGEERVVLLLDFVPQ
jgi:beta-hydroxylase